MVARAKVSIPDQSLQDFCRRWKITEFALFGSVLREDFRPESDVDILVSFAPDAHWGLFDLCRMEDELESMFGRRVDIITRRSVEQSENYIRRRAILENLEILHATR
ncbi:MAG: nucleotidyltransferase family protein [Planctomycetes bacterium]|nr:nucleotidyltransferase family protein [Planctomycetota bacterium]